MMGPLFEDDSGQGDIHLRISIMTVILSTLVRAGGGGVNQWTCPRDAGFEARSGGSAALRIEQLFPAVRPGKTPPHDALHDQVIGGVGDADAHSEVELPLWPEIHIDCRKELLLLICVADRILPANRMRRNTRAPRRFS